MPFRRRARKIFLTSSPEVRYWRKTSHSLRPKRWKWRGIYAEGDQIKAFVRMAGHLGGGVVPRGYPSSGTNCQAGTPDEGAARAVQASGCRGGNAPNPQLPRAFESFVALPSGMRE
ncbi:hypothetical protein E2I00_012549, partial [Balaenoptera physalus]